MYNMQNLRSPECKRRAAFFLTRVGERLQRSHCEPLNKISPERGSRRSRPQQNEVRLRNPTLEQWRRVSCSALSRHVDLTMNDRIYGGFIEVITRKEDL